MVHEPGQEDILEQTDMRLSCVLEMLVKTTYIPSFAHTLKHSTDLSGCMRKTSHLKEISSPQDSQGRYTGNLAPQGKLK